MRATCRRFNYIVNYKLLTIYDYQFPVFEPWLVYLDCDSEQCCPNRRRPHVTSNPSKYKYSRNYFRIELKTKFRFIKYRRLSLLTDPLIIEMVLRTSSNLQTITELNINVDHLSGYNTLNTILSKLLNIKRLSLDVGGSACKKRETISLAKVKRTMVCIELDGEFSENIHEHLLDNLPTERLTITITGQAVKHWKLSWLKRYLGRHRYTVKECYVTLDTTKQNGRTKRAIKFVKQSHKLLARLGFDTTLEVPRAPEQKPAHVVTCMGVSDYLRHQGCASCN